jgi:flavorubredoxin
MSPPLVPVTVVVAFYSRCGSAETRALTAAVGAVNARALIRMRRMPDLNAADELRQASPECAAELARMHKEYVPPTEADLAGADALILAGSDTCDAASPVWAPLVAMLDALAAKGTLVGKAGAVIGGGTAAASLGTLLRERGVTVVDPLMADGLDATPAGLEHIRAHGRRVAEVCRTVKSAHA